jgi:hypothetical protein
MEREAVAHDGPALGTGPEAKDGVLLVGIVLGQDGAQRLQGPLVRVGLAAGGTEAVQARVLPGIAVGGGGVDGRHHVQLAAAANEVDKGGLHSPVAPVRVDDELLAGRRHIYLSLVGGKVDLALAPLGFGDFDRGGCGSVQQDFGERHPQISSRCATPFPRKLDRSVGANLG